MIDEKLQKIANKTSKLIAELLKLPDSEKYEIRLVENNEVEGEVKVSEGKVLITCEVSDEPLAMFYTIAHELRHMHQMLYMDEFFKNYTLENMHDMNLYNEQPEEIDANAFSGFLCEAIFNVGCPPLEETSEKVMKKIERRAIELFQEYYSTSDFDYIKRRFQNNQIFEIYRNSAKKYQ
ncbi:MAG: hypothetical protein K6A61_02295 [Butyrivibrio sp.]|nr:hypothetical protein [Butyrivibrio sp.]